MVSDCTLVHVVRVNQDSGPATGSNDWSRVTYARLWCTSATAPLRSPNHLHTPAFGLPIFHPILA